MAEPRKYMHESMAKYLVNKVTDEMIKLKEYVEKADGEQGVNDLIELVNELFSGDNERLKSARKAIVEILTGPTGGIQRW